MSYLDQIEAFYDTVARDGAPGLCCTSAADPAFPDLVITAALRATSFGCGSTVDPRDLTQARTVVYVGVGGGKEALQFAYFVRRPAGVVAVEPVAAMRAAAGTNLAAAAAVNPWFDASFVELRDGNAFALPVPDGAADVVAQNCLFNVFAPDDLSRALAEARRVLRPGGKLCISDPIADEPLPAHVRDDIRLRAMCLGGALTWDAYVEQLARAGFGTVEVRRKRPYRVLDPSTYGLRAPLAIDSADVVAVNVPVESDGPCAFTGRTATYVGDEARWDDGRGHVMERGVPLDVCDKTARRLRRRPDVVVSPPTWHYAGGGCC